MHNISAGGEEEAGLCKESFQTIRKSFLKEQGVGASQATGFCYRPVAEPALKSGLKVI